MRIATSGSNKKSFPRFYTQSLYEGDPIWQTYNRVYKAHYARYLKKKMTAAQFEEWSRFASKSRNSAGKEKISFEDYYTKIRK